VTERIYIQNLVSLYESYCNPLKNRKKILTEAQIKKIFQNVEEIKELAKIIWKKLEGAARVWPEQEPRIGKIFIDSVRLVFPLLPPPPPLLILFITISFRVLDERVQLAIPHVPQGLH